MKKNLLTIALFLSFFSLRAEVKLPKIFGDHMVLQQNHPIRIWGWADSGEKVSISFNQQKKNTVADKSGKWSFTLDAVTAGGPYIMEIQGKNQITLSDVMIGEVWLCTGQSNMEFDLKGSLNSETEIKQSTNTFIRQFAVPKRASADPEEDLTGGNWQVSSPSTSGEFSAVAYYYAKKLSSRLNVAVGIVNASWGGTFIEDWISYESLLSLPDYSTFHDLTPEELEKWYSQIERKYDQLFNTLEIPDRYNITEDSANWSKPGFDDSKWLAAKLPDRFDYDLLPRFDGVVWFRRNVEVTEEMSKQGFTLHLGQIDDYDITYINGTKVGETMGVRDKRHYAVKPGVLKSGKNSIAIRLTDYWERGGFLNSESDFKITIGEKEIPLTGEWKMNIGKTTFMWLRSPNVHPNLLYNGMLHPLCNFNFRGVLWYQGENNTMYASQYEQNLKTMIPDWRKTFTSSQLPFYIVQLPNMDGFNTNSQHGGSNWAELREAQSKALELPNTYMVVTIDLGDSTDVHPKNKLDVGNRLALLALKNTYSMPVGEVSSPMVDSVSFEKHSVILFFRNTGTGLIARDRYGYLKGFELAGADKQFYWATAVIEENRIIVTSEKVVQPIAVRYAWSNNPSDANLYNLEGLPAAPYRSDDWDRVSKDEKYTNWIK
jgi:sialate O-acetylesterase